MGNCTGADTKHASKRMNLDASLVHPNVPASGRINFTSIQSISIRFLRASHDDTGAIQRGMNSWNGHELGAIDDLFITNKSPRDHINVDAMALIYDKIIALVTSSATHQTPVSDVGRIARIVRRWQLKYELGDGKFHDLPPYDAPPGSLQTFFRHAVRDNTHDLLIHVMPEDFCANQDPDVSLISYGNFSNFS